MEGREIVESCEVNNWALPASSLKKKPLNTLSLLAYLHEVLRIDYRGVLLPRGCVVILAIIHEETTRKGNLCKQKIVKSRFGNRSHVGNYVSILEGNGLILTSLNNGYKLTTDGELLLRNVITDLNRILLNKPTKRTSKKATGTSPHPWIKNVKGKYNAKPIVTIETFDQLVSEVLNKPGLNKKVKYALLRALGMDHVKAKKAIKQIAHLKNSERIRPILKGLLSQIEGDKVTKPQ